MFQNNLRNIPHHYRKIHEQSGIFWLYAGLLRSSAATFGPRSVVFTKSLGAETFDGLVDAFETWILLGFEVSDD